MKLILKGTISTVRAYLYRLMSELGEDATVEKAGLWERL